MDAVFCSDARGAESNSAIEPESHEWPLTAFGGRALRSTTTAGRAPSTVLHNNTRRSTDYRGTELFGKATGTVVYIRGQSS